MVATYNFGSVYICNLSTLYLHFVSLKHYINIYSGDFLNNIFIYYSQSDYYFQLIRNTEYLS